MSEAMSQPSSHSNEVVWHWDGAAWSEVALSGRPMRRPVLVMNRGRLSGRRGTRRALAPPAQQGSFDHRARPCAAAS